MYVISISGLDGSGKSTQVKLLKNYLESRGKRIFYFHAVKFSIGNKTAKMLHFCHPEHSEGSRLNSANDNSTGFLALARNDSKSVTRANWLQIQLRKIALRIDIWRFKKLVKKLEKQGYDYILSDRFFCDSIINIKYLTLQRHPERSKGSRLNNTSDNSTGFFTSPPAGGFIQNDILSIYLQTSPNLIMNRERVPDQGLEYLKDKKKLYDSYFENFLEAKIINGDKNKEEIFEKIKKATNRSSD